MPGLPRPPEPQCASIGRLGGDGPDRMARRPRISLSTVDEATVRIACSLIIIDAVTAKEVSLGGLVQPELVFVSGHQYRGDIVVPEKPPTHEIRE